MDSRKVVWSSLIAEIVTRRRDRPTHRYGRAVGRQRRPDDESVDVGNSITVGRARASCTPTKPAAAADVAPHESPADAKAPRQTSEGPRRPGDGHDAATATLAGQSLRVF